MPNLHGATPQSDRDDFARLWDGFCPDEIKIYPNQLLANAELYEYWQRGEFQPYTTEELIDLIADIKPTIPRYCRVNRVIRDIPSTQRGRGQPPHQPAAGRARRDETARHALRMHPLPRGARASRGSALPLTAGRPGLPGGRGRGAFPLLRHTG